MTSPLLASLFAATPVPMTVAHPVLMAPMASVAAITYSMRFQMLLNALLERFPADLGLVQVGPFSPIRVSAPLGKICRRHGMRSLTYSQAMLYTQHRPDHAARHSLMREISPYLAGDTACLGWV